MHHRHVISKSTSTVSADLHLHQVCYELATNPSDARRKVYQWQMGQENITLTFLVLLMCNYWPVRGLRIDSTVGLLLFCGVK